LAVTKFIIITDGIGQRVDKFLAERIPEFSRTEIQGMIKNLKNSHKLKPGDIIECNCETELAPKYDLIDNSTSATNQLPFDIAYEDEYVIAIIKPRGMVMYPSVGNKSGTLVQHLINYCPLSDLGGLTRPGVVHRIDKDTSGVVILAKTDAAFRGLTRLFSEHDLTRKYIAFIWGIPAWPDADIEGNIARSTRNRQKMSMVKTGGRKAKTSVHVKQLWPRAGISEISCQLYTGRTHQIRVHLSAHGFPILNDPVYGRSRENKTKPSKLLDFLRAHKGQCLHAEILELAHPITGEQLKIRAPLPNDLSDLKECLEIYN